MTSLSAQSTLTEQHLRTRRLLFVAIGIVALVLVADGYALSVNGSVSTETVVSTVTDASQTIPSPGAVIVMPYFVGQGYGNFEPASITVVVGVNNTVTWINEDQTAEHDVYFTSAPAGADVPQIPSAPIGYAHAYTITLTTPGVYKYECEYHYWMQGVIQVVG
jgi:plastocyanin